MIMKKHKIHFSNYFTKEEIAILSPSEVDEIDSKNLICFELEDKKLVSFEFEKIDHPTWDFKSSYLYFNGLESEERRVKKESAKYLMNRVIAMLDLELPLLINKQITLKKNNISAELKIWFIRAMRPFMHDHDTAYTAWSKLEQMGKLSDEINLLIGWRNNRIHFSKYKMDLIIRRFLKSKRATLDTRPEVIPALYMNLFKVEKPTLIQDALNKIRDLHGPDHPGRQRLEAVDAIWEARWDDYLSIYSKIPVDVHDWDPVPRYFLPAAVHYSFEDIESSLLAFHEVTYYGGIPLYLLYSTKGCWEFESGDYLAALESKQEAFHSGIQTDFVSIQIAVILNKLGRHSEVIPLFSNHVLYSIDENYDTEDIEAAMTQICIALESMGDPVVISEFEMKLRFINAKNIVEKYESAKKQHFVGLKDQTPIQRALEGCMGR